MPSYNEFEDLEEQPREEKIRRKSMPNPDPNRGKWKKSDYIRSSGKYQKTKAEEKTEDDVEE